MTTSQQPPAGRPHQSQPNQVPPAGFGPRQQPAGYGPPPAGYDPRAAYQQDHYQQQPYQQGPVPQQWSPVAAPPKKKRRHIFRWVFLGVQALFLIWLISGLSATGPACVSNLSAEACQAAQGIGTGIGVALIIGLWIAVDFILGITYLIFRKR